MYLYINKNQFEKETLRAVLINCPNKSDYRGYSFWFPKSLIYRGRSDESVKLFIPDSFEIKLKTRDDEIIVDNEEIFETFKATNDSIFPNKWETYKPERKEVHQVKALDELVDE